MERLALVVLLVGIGGSIPLALRGWRWVFAWLTLCAGLAGVCQLLTLGLSEALAGLALSGAVVLFLLSPRWGPRLERLAFQEGWGWLAVLELAIVGGVMYVFSERLLEFDEGLIPSGIEFEGVAGVIAVAYHSIREFGEFPLWNPFLSTGVPYLGQPYCHLFNPFVSVPGIILGPLNGPKVAMVVAYLLGGFGQYCLASVLGLSRPVRVWSALLFAMSGPTVLHFWAGHYAIGIVAPFIPLTFALTIQAMRSPNRVWPPLAGLSFALLLFSGMPYHVIFTIPGLLIVGLFYVVRWEPGRPPTVDVGAASRGVAAGLWAAGFSALQLLPLIESYPFVLKDTDPFLRGSRNLLATFQNFFISDPDFYTSRGMITHDHYAYVSLLPLAGLIAAPLAWRTGRRKELVLVAVLFLFYLCWAAAKHTFFRFIYDWIPWLYHIRGPTNALVPTAPFLIVAAGFGIDAVLRSCWTGVRRRGGQLAAFAVAAAFAVGLVGLVMAASGADIYSANGRFVGIVKRFPDHEHIARYLRQLDRSLYSVALVDGSFGVSLPLYDYHIKKLPTPWPWKPQLFAPPEGRTLEARPKYALLFSDRKPKDFDATTLGAVRGRTVYLLPSSPPYASLVSSSRFEAPADGPWKGIREVDARLVSYRTIEVVADAGPGEDRLLILESYYPGWSVEIDGRSKRRAENLGGFNSTRALPGTHTYRFTFESTTFSRGLAISLGTVLGVGLLAAAALLRGRLKIRSPVRRR